MVVERKPLELESFYSITTFIRAITSLLQIRQVARLRSTTCNLQGLSPTQRSTQTTPSRDAHFRGQEDFVLILRDTPLNGCVDGPHDFVIFELYSLIMVVRTGLVLPI